MIKFTKNLTYTVCLDGMNIGTIKQVPGGWQYFPKHHKAGGAVFGNVAACVKDVAGDQWSSAVVE